MQKVKDISRVVVAGAGTMGVTMVRIFAQNGYQATLWNHRASSLERAKERIQADLIRLHSEGTLTEQPEDILARITYTTAYEPFRTASFVVENIVEDLETKRAFFRTVCTYVPEDTVLATNTSGLRVTELAQAVTNPARFCGMHWWNPPDLLPLVEITKGEKTGQEAAELVYALAVSLGKKPVIVRKDILGIIGNRLQYAVLREALHIMEMGAAGPAEIDAAMKYGPGFRYPTIGPFETVDLGGLDLFRTVSNYLFAELSTAQHSETLNRLADAGHFGVRTGEGFYPYADGEGEAKLLWRNEKFKQQKHLIDE